MYEHLFKFQKLPFKYPWPPHASLHSCTASRHVQEAMGLVQLEIAWISTPSDF